MGAGGQTTFTKANVLNESERAALSPEVNDILSSPLSNTEAETLINVVFNENHRWQPEMARECRKQLSIWPKKSSAILFYNMNTLWDLDVMAEHGACPVLAGEKWGANIWVWN